MAGFTLIFQARFGVGHGDLGGGPVAPTGAIPTVDLYGVKAGVSATGRFDPGDIILAITVEIERTQQIDFTLGACLVADGKPFRAPI